LAHGSLNQAFEFCEVAGEVIALEAAQGFGGDLGLLFASAATLQG